MPELRSRMIQEACAIPHVRQGFWIRAATPAAAASQRKQVWRVRAGRSKENVNTPRRSQLPAWYPRIPLRDITHIVHALERRRSTQVRRAQPNLDETEVSPESNVLQSSLFFQASNTFDRTPPNETFPDESSDTSSSTLVVSTLPSISPSQYAQKTPSTTTCFSPSELSSELELATSLSTEYLQTTEYEKKLGNSIDELEKVVFGNFKRPTMVPAKKTTGALMSMR